jgi:multidrug resistance protein, MATE family
MMIYGEWEVMTIMISFMGPAEVAAWGLLGYVWSVFEYINGGIATAGEVRVGRFMGSGNYERARHAGYTTLYMAFVVAVTMSGITYMLAGPICKCITPDPTLQRMIYDVMPLIGLSQMALIISTTCWTILGAQGRYRIATKLGFFGSWFVTIPCAAISVFYLNWNIQGPVASIVVGATMSGTAIMGFVLTSDWKRLSDQIIANSSEDSTLLCSEEIGSSDDDDDDDDSIEDGVNQKSATCKRLIV